MTGRSVHIVWSIPKPIYCLDAFKFEYLSIPPPPHRREELLPSVSIECLPRSIVWPDTFFLALQRPLLDPSKNCLQTLYLFATPLRIIVKLSYIVFLSWQPKWHLPAAAEAEAASSSWRGFTISMPNTGLLLRQTNWDRLRVLSVGIFSFDAQDETQNATQRRL